MGVPPHREPPGDAPPANVLQGPPQATVVSGGQVTPELLLQEQEPPWTPPCGAEGLECPPQLSPPHLDPQLTETPELGEWGGHGEGGHERGHAGSP